jgi:hypothetical protein
MRFRYQGPHDAVDIPALGVIVAHGETIEVTGAIAEEFVKRDDWERVDKPKTKDADDA